MKFNDLKEGTIIEYFGRYDTNYAVVIGISKDYEYEKNFVTKDSYSNIVIVAYKLVSVGLPKHLKDNENALRLRKQFVNGILTTVMNKELNPNLMATYALNLVDKVDMKPRTQEIKAWLLKNKMLHPTLLDDIVDVEDRKKRLKKIIAEREKYYSLLEKKLSCYDTRIKNLEKNFDKLKFGEVYVSTDYLSDAYFYICFGVHKGYFYRIQRNCTIEENLASFVLSLGSDEILSYCCRLSSKSFYDTGVNIMAYWWNKEQYEKISNLN